jgi:hypothetical protein
VNNLKEKCPLCKHTINKKDYTYLLTIIRQKLSSKTLKAIDSVLKKMNGLTGIEAYGFFLEIEEIEHDIIIKSLETFKNRGYLEQGYNLKYLAGIIKNEYKAYAMRNKYEKDNLDRLPPIMEHNE